MSWYLWYLFWNQRKARTSILLSLFQKLFTVYILCVQSFNPDRLFLYVILLFLLSGCVLKRACMSTDNNIYIMSEYVNIIPGPEYTMTCAYVKESRTRGRECRRLHDKQLTQRQELGNEQHQNRDWRQRSRFILALSEGCSVLPVLWMLYYRRRGEINK